ncbi:MAG: ABC transporter ATP-binding protein [Proteobacteria bacterium]|nr:ABC transporter ATP-binding protein [Pseudomonadota bacterium]
MAKEQYTALKGISFSVNRGEMATIIGASGSGKTTTMNILGLLDHPTTGNYFLDGINTSSLTPDQLADYRNLKIGFIFQSFFLLPRLTALQNVMLPLTYRRNHSDDDHDDKKKARAMLAKVGMIKYVTHKPFELSGGQQQRVAIARALVGTPSIILADEPTGALDAKNSQDVLELLKDLNQTEGATIVIITHDPEVAQKSQRIIKIYDGRIV